MERKSLHRTSSHASAPPVEEVPDAVLNVVMEGEAEGIETINDNEVAFGDMLGWQPGELDIPDLPPDDDKPPEQKQVDEKQRPAEEKRTHVKKSKTYICLPGRCIHNPHIVSLALSIVVLVVSLFTGGILRPTDTQSCNCDVHAAVQLELQNVLQQLDTTESSMLDESLNPFLRLRDMISTVNTTLHNHITVNHDLRTDIWNINQTVQQSNMRLHALQANVSRAEERLAELANCNCARNESDILALSKLNSSLAELYDTIHRVDIINSTLLTTIPRIDVLNATLNSHVNISCCAQLGATIQQNSQRLSTLQDALQQISVNDSCSLALSTLNRTTELLHDTIGRVNALNSSLLDITPRIDALNTSLQQHCSCHNASNLSLVWLYIDSLNKTLQHNHAQLSMVQSNLSSVQDRLEQLFEYTNNQSNVLILSKINSTLDMLLYRLDYLNASVDALNASFHHHLASYNISSVPLLFTRIGILNVTMQQHIIRLTVFQTNLSSIQHRLESCSNASHVLVFYNVKFGVAIEKADELIAAKTVTIAKLMEIAPHGVQDPTPFIYNTTMYAMAGFMCMAAIAHQTVKPVDPKYFETPEEAAASAKVN